MIFCANCKFREGKNNWTGETTGVDAIRRMGSWPKWCDLCVAEAQLKYAREAAAKIPDLERKVAELLLAESMKL